MVSESKRNFHIVRLKRALAEIPELRAEHTADHVEVTSWRDRTHQALVEVFGADHPYVTRLFYISFRESRISLGPGPSPWLDVDQQRYERGLAETEQLLQDVLEELAVSSDPTESAKPAREAAREFLTRLFDRFHIVVRQLGERRRDRSTLTINDEYDVQDLLHALLRLFFEDVRAEESTPSYPAKSSRVDFLLKAVGIVVEVKMTRSGLGAKEIGDQLIQDIARYKSHPDCRTLVCFVYDPAGMVANPGGLESDLSGGQEGMDVEVFVRPTGL